MDITESLLQAVTLFGLGMGFVFAFLGLLMIFVKLMAKYIPADEPVAVKKPTPRSPVATAASELNPKLVAAITTAVQQYRQAKPA